MSFKWGIVMRILFLGGTKTNSGPCNVNRGIIRNLSDSFCILSRQNKLQRLQEIFRKCLYSDVVVVSGVAIQNCVATGFAKMCRKKVVYIMHGCAEFEAQVNRQKIKEGSLRQEQFLLKNSDLLLPVSKKFQSWVCSRYPQYADKVKYLYNGIDKAILAEYGGIKKKKGSIAAAGADRGVKNNIVVAHAVEEMNGKANLTVYGAIYHEAPTGFEHTKYIGRIPHEEYLRRLEGTELFVVNSVFETFSISAVEALCCGCSLLVSEIVGVTDLLELEECDIIQDPMNEEEIREKIEYLLEHPNNQRILDKLDIDEYSYAKQVERLEALCRELVEKP